MNFSILLFGLGATEIVLIVVAIVLLFGGKKIPELMKGLGSGIREFKDAKDKGKDELNRGANGSNAANKENSNDNEA